MLIKAEKLRIEIDVVCVRGSENVDVKTVLDAAKQMGILKLPLETELDDYDITIERPVDPKEPEKRKADLNNPAWPGERIVLTRKT